MSTNWNHPICDECWPAYTLMHAKAPHEPYRFKEEFREVETCCFCGVENRSGIYVREDGRLLSKCGCNVSQAT